MEEVIEVCPNCMKENDFMWDIKKDGHQAHCLHCGELIMLCTECPKSVVNGDASCDWDSETGRCSVRKD